MGPLDPRARVMAAAEAQHNADATRRGLNPTPTFVVGNTVVTPVGVEAAGSGKGDRRRYVHKSGEYDAIPAPTRPLMPTSPALVPKAVTKR
jgi:hypothetical protein